MPRPPILVTLVLISTGTYASPVDWMHVNVM